MNAIGLIETKGLIPAIEAADIMLKTAQVALLDRTLVGGGLVTITVTGDVGAVKAAVDAAVTAVQQFGSEQLKTHHVIPRPHDEVDTLFLTKKSVAVESVEDDSEVMVKEMPLPLEIEALSEAELNRLSVKKLRELAANYNNLGMSKQSLAMANKATLIKRFNEQVHQKDSE